MLEISEETQRYVDEVKTFAESVGALAKLQKQLDYLDTYAEHEDRGRTLCVLYKDFAPNSFSFVMNIRPKGGGEYAFWYNGGLICYPPGDSGVGAPQFSVNLTTSDEYEWHVNT